MKTHRGLWIFLAAVALIAAACWGIWQATSEYPEVGEVIDAPVNEVPGLALTLEAPSFSPFRGYTLRFAIAADTPEPYLLHWLPGENFWLEAHIDGQWRRLVCILDPDVYFDQKDTLGGDTTGFQASLVQKYDGYGTRLRPGDYRLTVQVTDAEGTAHLLAAPFAVD